jgi:hypothetical protein
MAGLRHDWASLFNRKKPTSSSEPLTSKAVLPQTVVEAAREPSFSPEFVGATGEFKSVFGCEPKTDLAVVVAAALDAEAMAHSPQQVVVGMAQLGARQQAWLGRPAEEGFLPDAGEFEPLGGLEPEDGEDKEGEQDPVAPPFTIAPIEEECDEEGERDVELQPERAEPEKHAKRAKRVENVWTTVLSAATLIQLEQRLASEARLAFNGNAANGLDWKWRERVEQKALSKKHKCVVTSIVGVCAFKNVPACACKASVKYIQYGTAGQPGTTYDLLTGSVPHSNHAISSESGRRMPMAVKSMLSPGKLFLSKGEFLKQVVAKGATMGQERMQHAKNWQNQCRRKFKEEVSGLSFKAQSTLGGLRSVVDARLPQNLEHFDEHTVHVVGDHIVKTAGGCDGGEKKGGGKPPGGSCSTSSSGPDIAVVLSTEALLLNGYRMTRQAQPMQLVVDTTWKLVEEGHGCIVIGAVSVDQRFHAIAYAFVDQECTFAHTFVFSQVRQGIERVVQKYADNRWLI